MIERATLEELLHSKWLQITEDDCFVEGKCSNCTSHCPANYNPEHRVSPDDPRWNYSNRDSGVVRDSGSERRTSLRLTVTIPEGTDIALVVDELEKFMKESTTRLRLSAIHTGVKKETVQWQMIYEVAYI